MHAVKVPPSSAIFDWTMSTLCSIFFFGLYYDFWYHGNAPYAALETFLTPTHLTFYGAFLLILIYLFISALMNYSKGYSLKALLPSGYGISVIGIFVFVVGGIGDFLWHYFIGVERNINTLLSPAHLFIISGFTLIVSGPIKSIWNQPKTKYNFISQLPMLISVLGLWTLFAMLTQYVHPIVRPYAGLEYRNLTVFLSQTVGVISIVFQAILLIGWVILLLKKWIILPGSFTLMLTVNAFIMSIMGTYTDKFNPGFIIAAFISGLIADFLLYKLKPSINNKVSFYLFCFLLPISSNSLYFLFLYLTRGVWWTSHLWVGTILMSGIAGLLFSYISLADNKKVH